MALLEFMAEVVSPQSTKRLPSAWTGLESLVSSEEECSADYWHAGAERKTHRARGSNAFATAPNTHFWGLHRSSPSRRFLALLVPLTTTVPVSVQRHCCILCTSLTNDRLSQPLN